MTIKKLEKQKKLLDCLKKINIKTEDNLKRLNKLLINTYMPKKLVKNCATCWWSRRDYETLTLYCNQLPNHQMKIENGTEDARTCQAYTFEAPKNTQTQLFT